MWLRILTLLLCTTCCCLSAQGQPTYNTIVRDTIITHKEVLNRTYLLNGKIITLPVMQWFMSDYPKAYDEIRLAVLCDQLSIGGYSVGSLFAMSGLFVYGQDAALGEELIKVGLVGVGSGIVFQILGGRFKKNAVRIYNQEIKANYRRRQSAQLKLGYGSAGVVLILGF